jgi:hypothetical protein
LVHLFPVLVCCTKKNLAPLLVQPVLFFARKSFSP